VASAGFTILQPAVSTASISPNGGTFDGAVTISISTITPNAFIRYTLDGTEPGTSSKLYSAPIRLVATATVKARGYRSGHDPSLAASAQFVVNPGTLIIEGPNERGEPPIYTGTNGVTVRIYGQGLLAVGAMQTALRFALGGTPSGGFLISLTDGNPDFGGQAIWANTTLFPTCFGLYDDARVNAGFMTMGADRNVISKTLLLTIYYDVPTGAPTGTWAIDADRSVTLVGGNYGETPFTTVSGGLVITAKWRVAGDANNDCSVNILDLIRIRNLIGSNPGTGENWWANVNEDGAINVLDLIYARNRIGTACR